MAPDWNDVARKATAMAKKSGNAAVRNLDPLDAIRMLCELQAATQAEHTRRDEIRAKRDVAVATIVANREVLEGYFRLRFAERRAALDEMFRLLGHACDTSSEKELDQALGGILSVVRDNPLSDFEAFRRAWLDGGVVEI